MWKSLWASELLTHTCLAGFELPLQRLPLGCERLVGQIHVTRMNDTDGEVLLSCYCFVLFAWLQSRLVAFGTSRIGWLHWLDRIKFEILGFSVGSCVLAFGSFIGVVRCWFLRALTVVSGKAVTPCNAHTLRAFR
jgi:hypothetical protein